MNILFCGDANVADGLIISVLSLLRNVSEEELVVYVFTLSYTHNGKTFHPMNSKVIAALDARMKQQNSSNRIQCIDTTQLFEQELPKSNLNTRFTPCCMLRLYADSIPEIPDRILYLDTDVICRRSFHDFYYQDLNDTEIVGALDRYGKWFFHKKPFKQDYLNSGVLLLNMVKIRETKLFAKARRMCIEKKMFMPDQSALNELSDTKRICSRRYNEQAKLREDTVFQHFSTRFRAYPPFKITIKPWQIEELHRVFKLHEYDDLLSEYIAFKESNHLIIK